jgi:hypothetical protein
MSDPTKHHDEPDDLDLDAETVADLDPDKPEDVQGGLLVGRYTDQVMCTFTCLTCITVCVCAAK